MKLGIYKLEANAIIPTYGSNEASGMDMYVLQDTEIPAGETVLVRTGIVFNIPIGYEIQIRPRSGVSLKTPLRVANAPGTVDSDYTGECNIILTNYSELDIIVNRGDRIAQAVLCPVIRAEPEILLTHPSITKQTQRGQNGFGSTGK